LVLEVADACKENEFFNMLNTVKENLDSIERMGRAAVLMEMAVGPNTIHGQKCAIDARTQSMKLSKTTGREV
jgi:hypothetical protein